MSVEVILLERIERLGHLGDVVKVAPGYARNFLLPTGKALRANAENKARFQAEKARYETENENKKIAAEKLAKNVDGATVKIVRAASETGQLFGSVSARDVAESLSAIGHDVERQSVLIGKAIKDIGEHEVKLRFHADVLASVKVQVVKNKDDVVVTAPSREDIKLSKVETAERLKAEKKEAAERAKLQKQAEKNMTEASAEEADEVPAKKAASKADKADKPASKTASKADKAEKKPAKKAAKKK
ncbi:MAG: 50S ribosomal protein L9 [Alphaproteobacteria bacterium]|nr:50S ribosomal protein L9 [Alphaproteobacteria bacterium]